MWDCCAHSSIPMTHRLIGGTSKGKAKEFGGKREGDKARKREVVKEVYLLSCKSFLIPINTVSQNNVM